MNKPQPGFQLSIFDRRSLAEIIKDLRRSSRSRTLTQSLSLINQGFENLNLLLNDQRFPPKTRSLLDELLRQYQDKSIFEGLGRKDGLQ